MNGVSVIDADGHILETDAELEQYFEGSYKGHKRSGVIFHLPLPRRLAARFRPRLGKN